MIRLAAVFLFLSVTRLCAQPVPEPPLPPDMTFEKANAIVRYDCTFVRLQVDGKSETLRHYRTAVLTDRAIRENAQDVSVYNMSYDTVEILAARVHLPSGGMVEVDGEAIKDVPMPAFGKFFLQNVREKIITFPALVQGAEIEVLLKETTREPPMDGEFELAEGFEQSDPMRQRYVEILAPKDVELRWKAHGGEIPYTKIAVGDHVRHVWRTENVPQFVPEPGMPPFPEVSRRLFVTTVDDWTVWSRWYHRLSEPEMAADDDVRQAVRELTAGKTLPEDKVKAIFYFVSNQIRYVETAMTGRKAGYKPESATTTFRNKYGVCRDKAALMVTMLREAGISSDIVLMNPAWKIDAEIPVDQFNHAIVAVHDGGRTYFVDPTVEKTKDFLAANEQDRAVLVCDADGEDLTWTPIVPSEQNLYQVRAKSQLTDDGTFRSEVTITTRGFPDHILRSSFQSIPPEERNNRIKRIIQRFSAMALLDTVIFSDLMDFSQAVEIKLTFHARDYWTPAGKYVLFKLPGQSTGLDILTRAFLRGSELTTRRYDLRLSSTFAVRSEETLEYPKHLRVRSLPIAIDQNYGDFRLARECRAKGKSIMVRRVVDFSTLTVPLSRYGQLQELLRKEDEMARGQVVLIQG